MTGARLASGFWVAAKLRQIQNAGGYASVLVRGHDEAGTINLVHRSRDGRLRLATAAIQVDQSTDQFSDGRVFEWRGDPADNEGLNDEELTALIARELRFDRDQWFIECECSEDEFRAVFNVKTG